MPKIVKIPHPKKIQPVIKTRAEKKRENREAVIQKAKEKQSFAENLANNPTASEALMCGLLDRLNIKYECQKIVCGYIPDFVINSNKVLELDGKHHKLQKKYDNKRDDVLRKHGYKVLRIASGRMFWDADRVTDLVKSFAFGTKKKDIPKPKHKKKKDRIQPEEKDELTESFLFYTQGL